jgi:hypothetical protein
LLRYQEDRHLQIMPGITYSYVFRNKLQVYSAARTSNVGLIDTGSDCPVGEPDFNKLKFMNYQFGAFYKFGKYRLQPKIGLALNYETYKINSGYHNNSKIYAHSKADFLGFNTILAFDYRIYKKLSVQLQTELSTNQMLSEKANSGESQYEKFVYDFWYCY